MRRRLRQVVQNSMNAGDNSLAGGLVSAVTLIVVTDGRVHVGALRRELLTLAELRSALRKQGIMGITNCKQMTLEPDGALPAEGDLRHRQVNQPASLRSDHDV